MARIKQVLMKHKELKVITAFIRSLCTLCFPYALFWLRGQRRKNEALFLSFALLALSSFLAKRSKEKRRKK
jgi:hypothetical protein